MPIEQHMYTSCPPDKGYDRIDGFQTKACSPGVTPAMQSLIRAYCGRYRLPRSAQAIEYACRREGRQVPAEALAHFPVALTYYRVDADVFALTRTCYRGQDHSGRFGTFFAHTLVFPVTALQPVDYNPLALTRTHLFQSADPSDRTTLPVLPDLQTLQVPPDPSSMSLVAQEPYAGQLAHLLTATIGMPQTGRPVVLCLPGWDHAARLIEALLMLLPPEVRCRTPFTTYEHDPYRLQGLGTAHRQRVPFPLQIVVTLSRAEGGAFKFQHDEYRARFAIFNFAEQRFSPPPAPSAYAQYVADCCQQRRFESVTSVHRLVTDLEVAREPEHWERLLPVVALEQPDAPQLGAEAVRQATAALLAVARRPPQVATAMQRLWPFVQHVSRCDPATLFAPALQTYRELLGRLPTDAPRRTQAQHALLTLVGQLLQEGRAQRAQVTLAALAPHQGAALATTLWYLVDAGWPGSTDVAVLARQQDDRAVLPELLIGALQAMPAQSVGLQVLSTMVAAAYEVAGKVGCLPAIWMRTGMSLVLPLLDSLDRTAALTLVSRLLTLLTWEACPDGLLALRLWQWQVQPPQALDHCLHEARALARLATRCAEPQQAATRLVEHVRQNCGIGDYATVLEAMAEAAGKHAAVQQVLCHAYVQTLRPPVTERGRRSVSSSGRRARLWDRLLKSH